MPPGSRPPNGAADPSSFMVHPSAMCYPTGPMEQTRRGFMGLLAAVGVAPTALLSSAPSPIVPVASILDLDASGRFMRANCGSFRACGMYGSETDYVAEAMVMSSDGHRTAQRIDAAPDVFGHACAVMLGRLPPPKEGELPGDDFRYFRYRFLGAEIVPVASMPAGELCLVLHGTTVAVLSGWTA